MTDVVVFTAMLGGRDELRDPEVVLPGVDYVCFTDEVVRSSAWQVVPMPVATEPRRASRLIKILSHVWFPEHRFSIWHDASMRATARVTEAIDELGGAPMGAFLHRWRDCVYDEADAAVEHGRVLERDVRPQVDRYRRQGMPARFGLHECGFIVREHTAAVVAFNRVWREAFGTGCARDQISFPWAHWRSGIEVHGFAPGTVVDNRFVSFDLEGHVARSRPIVQDDRRPPDPRTERQGPDRVIGGVR